MIAILLSSSIPRISKVHIENMQVNRIWFFSYKCVLIKYDVFTSRKMVDGKI